MWFRGNHSEEIPLANTWNKKELWGISLANANKTNKPQNNINIILDCFDGKYTHRTNTWQEGSIYNYMQMNWIISKHMIPPLLSIFTNPLWWTTRILDADNFNQICENLQHFIDFEPWIRGKHFLWWKVFRKNHCNAQKNMRSEKNKNHGNLGIHMSGNCQNHSVGLPNLGLAP